METLPIIFIAVAVAGLVWGITLLVTRLGASDKRKLQHRLGAESHYESDSQGQSRALLRRTENTGLPDFLNKLPVIQRLQRWLRQGLPEASLIKFLCIAAAFAFLPVIIVMSITGNTIMAAMLGVVGLCLPVMFVSSRRNKRRKQFSMQLPEALDFLSRVLRSGQSFSTAMQMMSEELPDPLSGEFRRCYDQHSLGQSIEEGLKDMAIRIDSTDFSFFVTAVVIQRQTGGDLAEVLRNISDMIRKRIRLAQSVKAKTAEGRFTGYVMVAFPIVMFIIIYCIDPAHGDLLLKTSTGHMLLWIAAGLELLGLFLIKKITTIKV